MQMGGEWPFPVKLGKKSSENAAKVSKPWLE